MSILLVNKIIFYKLSLFLTATVTDKQAPCLDFDCKPSQFILCPYPGEEEEKVNEELCGSLAFQRKPQRKEEKRYLKLLKALNYIHIIDFTLFNISFIFLWDVILLLSFSFSTSSNLVIEKKKKQKLQVKEDNISCIT